MTTPEELVALLLAALATSRAWGAPELLARLKANLGAIDVQASLSPAAHLASTYRVRAEEGRFDNLVAGDLADLAAALSHESSMVWGYVVCFPNGSSYVYITATGELLGCLVFEDR